MINRLSNMVCWLVLVMAFIVAGCQQEHKKETTADESKVEVSVVVPEYASRAIDATGGRQAWIKAKRLEFDCVVTFYKPDGSFHLTEHHYEIYPWSNSIRISAQEPQGKFVWLLSPDGFSALERAKQVNDLLIAVENRHFSEAILDITTAPVRLLDESANFTKRSKPVKMEGLWYYPIERTTPAGNKQGDVKPHWSKVVFYQNRDSSLVDMLWFVAVAPANNKQGLLVRGYDYREVEKRGVCVPAKIEIFKTDAQGVSPKQLVKMDFFLKAR